MMVPRKVVEHVYKYILTKIMYRKLDPDILIYENC